ncbi:hypothetical protein Tco_0697585 [Tanacetum coccineum]
MAALKLRQLKIKVLITTLPHDDLEELERHMKRCGDPNHPIGECSKLPKNNDQRAFIGGAWSDNREDGVGKTKDETFLVA